MSAVLIAHALVLLLAIGFARALASRAPEEKCHD